MLSRKLLFLLALCVSTSAFGQIDRISPSTLFVGPYEDFLTVYGSNLVGTESTLIEFSGPAGTFALESAASGVHGEYVVTWIPLLVSLTEGSYEIRVYATDVGSATRVYGPATLSVVEQVIVAPPLLFVPEGLVVPATGPTGANVTYPVEAISQGGTGLTVNCTPPSGSLLPLGQTSVTCTATDSIGSTSQSFTVYVADYTAPVFTHVPGDISTTNPVVTYSVTATDAIDGANVIIGCDPPSGATFPFGTTNVQCIAYDQSFNPAYASFNVTVAGGPPVLTLPPNIVEEATSAAGAVVNYTVTATNDGVVSCSPASGSTFAIGTTTVNCSATNAAGSATGSFLVTVRDTTAPMLVLPSPITTEATSASGAMVTFVATATDLVSGSVVVTCVPPSGSTFPIGTTTVNCSASDAAGNPATGSFTVTVRDSTPPVVHSITATPGTLWPPNHKLVEVALTVNATDAVDPSPVSTILSVSSSQPINGTGDGDTAPDWYITGSLTLQLRAERSGNVERIYTITVQTVDSSGNFVISTVQVRVRDSKRRS